MPGSATGGPQSSPNVSSRSVQLSLLANARGLRLKAMVFAASFRLLVYSVTAYVAVGAFLYFRQSALIFPAPKAWANVTPANCGLPYEDLQISVTSKDRVHGWWIPAATHSEKILLVLHGNGYVLEDMVGEELIALHQIGVNVLMIDYRGYGLSTSVRPRELSIVEHAKAALQYLHLLKSGTFPFAMCSSWEDRLGAGRQRNSPMNAKTWVA